MPIYLLFILLFTSLSALAQPQDVELKERTAALKDPKEKAIAILELLNSGSIKSRKKSLHYTREVYKLAKEAKDLRLQGEALVLLAEHDVNDNPKDSYWHYQQAYEIAQKIKDYPLMARIINGLANRYIFLKQYDKASKWINQEIALVEKENLDPLPAYSLKAKIYAEQKKPNKAMEYLQKVLKIQLKSKDLAEAAATYSEMGNTYYRIANYTKARKYYREGLEIANKLQNPQVFGFIYDNIGLSYYQEQNFEEALYWQVKALEQRREFEGEIGIIVSLNNLSKTYLALQNYEAALKHATESYDLLQSMPDQLVLSQEVSEVLAESYQASKQPDKAYQFLQKAHYYQNKINEQKQEAILRSATSQLEIAQQKLENERLEAKNQRLFLMQIFLLVFVTLTTLVIFILVRQSKARKKLLLELQEVNRNKDKLFSIIAHDLKSPINSIRALLDLLAEGLISREEMTQLSDKLRHNTGQVSLLLNNLLLWAKAQFQGLETNLQTIDLQEVAESQIALLSALAEHKNITIKLQLAAETKVLADQDQLALIVRNLLNNALKFTQKGGEVHISATPDKIKNKVIVSIRDTGIGIPPDVQKHLFNNDSQQSTRGTNNEKGTGLGLLLVKEMLDKQDGDIWLESQVGEGSIFYFSLPLVSAQSEQSHQV